MSRSRCHCFTINNYSTQEWDQFQTINCKYVIAAQEVCPSTGTPHIQGYISFKDPKTKQAAGKCLGGRARCDIRRGTPQEAADYCRGGVNDKPINDVVYERGELPSTKGIKKSNAIQFIQQNPNMTAFLLTYPSYNDIRLAEAAMKYLDKPRDFKPKVVWVYGPTGVGKTRDIYTLAQQNYSSIHEQSFSCKWWDGYDGQECIIIDDIRSSFCPFVYFLKLIDRYQLKVDIKGSKRHMSAKCFYITSPMSPAHVWDTSEDKTQLWRRLDEVYYVNHDRKPDWDIMSNWEQVWPEPPCTDDA